MLMKNHNETRNHKPPILLNTAGGQFITTSTNSLRNTASSKFIHISFIIEKDNDSALL
jgi:hypothetical protein